ncbi:MAG: HigA family addiction module antitoxin [Acidobacteriota bacterium]
MTGFSDEPRDFPPINEVVCGRRAITADTALRLASLFKKSAEFWTDLQVSWDLYQARLAMKKAG